MRTTQQFSITLPLEMAEAVEGKIKSGAYASVSEVMRDGVRALLERDAAVEKWLREEVVAGHREYLADPSKRRSGGGDSRSHQGAPRGTPVAAARACCIHAAGGTSFGRSARLH